MENHTQIDEFVLLGITNIPELQLVLFLAFLVIYMVTLLGNAAIIAVSWMDPGLHSPMYFFIANLSFLDVCYSSATVPKMLTNFLVERKTISFAGCTAQMLFFMSFAGTETVFLGAMAYDRYIAICHPLHYNSIMSRTFCSLLVSGSWAAGLVDSIVHTALAHRLSFCSSHTINHFFCDILAVLNISCTSTSLNKIMLIALGGVVCLTPFTLILASYIKIVTAVLRINSVEGRSRTFSTCTSHLMVIILFYLTITFTYFWPGSSPELVQNSLVAILYAVVTPLLNPFIFSLRNNAMKEALRRMVGKMGAFTLR